MKIISVQPKDIYVTVEFSLKQLEYIESVLDISKIEFDSEKNPEMVKAVNYVIDGFYSTLLEFLNDLEKE